MRESTREERLRLVAGRFGLKLISRSYGTTSVERFSLRPLWDATLAVHSPPDGSYTIIKIRPQGRTTATHWLTLAGIEQVLNNWTRPWPCAPARVPPTFNHETVGRLSQGRRGNC
jgi:hypothetical protein